MNGLTTGHLVNIFAVLFKVFGAFNVTLDLFVVCSSMKNKKFVRNPATLSTRRKSRAQPRCQTTIPMSCLRAVTLAPCINGFRTS